MRYNLNFRHIKSPLIAFFSFILGCTFIINLTPINKTCTLQNIDREFNIMHDSKLKNPDLVIIILSAPTNVDRRNIIRQTWLRLHKSHHESHDHEQFKVKHYFVVGNIGLADVEIVKLDSEQSRYNDILLVPIHDDYVNLTDKVKKSLEWLDEQIDYGLGFKYMLKCDDDSFVVLNSFIEELQNIEKLYLKSDLQNVFQLISNQNNNLLLSMNVQMNNKLANKNNLSLYWGYFNGNAKIQNKGKWKETEWIAGDRYTPYALGGGYLLSKDLVKYIAKNSKYFRSFTSEDISVGFWLAPVDNILRIHDVRFDTEWTTRGCRNHYLISHNLQITDMRVMFKNLLTYKQLCQKEVIKRNYYLYNWIGPPSQCCKVT